MAESAVGVDGLKEFRRELRAIEGKWAPEMTKVERQVAQFVAARAVGAASGMGGSTGHFASSIRGSASAAGGKVGVLPKANAAFWGAKKRTGWNAGHGGAPQHPAWVGSSWEPGGAGGPYAINPTIRASLPEIEKQFLDGVEDVTRRAFPGGS